MAKGTKVPDSVIVSMLNEAKDKQRVKEQRIHDWKIAVFTTFGGALLSKPLWDFAIPWIINLFSHTQP